MRGRKLHRHIIGGLAFTDGVILHTSDTVVMASRESGGSISTKFWTVREREGAPYMAKFFGVRGLWLLWRTITLNSWLRNFIDKNTTPSRDYENSDENKPLKKYSKTHTPVSIVPVAGLFLAFLAYMLVVFSFVLSTHLKSGSIEEIKSDLTLLAMLIVMMVWIFRSSKFWNYMGYHGAQHQAIVAYENGSIGEEDIYDAWPFQWRCGAAVVSYVAILMALTGIIIPSMTFFESLCFALIYFSLSYELVMFLDKHSTNHWAKLFFGPGVILQFLIARHPSAEQSQVAHAAIKMLDENSAVLKRRGRIEEEDVLT